MWDIQDPNCRPLACHPPTGRFTGGANLAGKTKIRKNSEPDFRLCIHNILRKYYLIRIFLFPNFIPKSKSLTVSESLKRSDLCHQKSLTNTQDEIQLVSGLQQALE